MKKILYTIVSIILILVLILLINSCIVSKKYQITPAHVVDISLSDSVVTKLSKSIEFKTISYPDRLDTAVFVAFHNYLKQSFPLTDSLLKREIINELSLLYTWQGSDKSLAPIILTGHLDIVPVDTSSIQEWKYPPFKGIIKENYVWGRGAVDDKLRIIGTLEAVESLLKQGFSPKRTILICFGHDEEIGGKNGAKIITQRLLEQKVQAEFLLEEGMVVVENIPFTTNRIGFIGTAEKGYTSITLTVESEGGHPASPPKHTTIGILSEAVTKIENRPMKAKIISPVKDMFRHIGPEAKFPYNIVFNNLWITTPALKTVLSQRDVTKSTIQTTNAVTMFNAGQKDNVLPTKASTTINFRILPGETIDDVVQHIKKVINNDDIKISVSDFAFNPSKISSTKSNSFNFLKQNIKGIYPDAVIAPALVLVNTDSRHYQQLTDNVFRFVPISAGEEELRGIHGINERVSIKNLKIAVKFYYNLIYNATSKNSL